MSLRPASAVPAALALALCLAAPAAAQQDGAGGAVTVELNKLEPADGACRSYLVVENGRDAAFETLTLDVVVFDAEGIVARRLAVALGALGPGKRSVRAFDLADLSCDGVGSLLLNGVLACEGPAATDACARLIETRSRADAPFDG